MTALRGYFPLARALRWAGAIAAAACIAAAVFGPQLAALKWQLEAGEPTVSATRPQLARGLAWTDDWFAVAELAPGVFAIGEPRYGQCNFAYLFVGTRRALLFDTGPGVRDISQVVARLTSLPVTALPSHLHFDHVGGLARFNDVALPDLPALRAQATRVGVPLRHFQHLGFVEGFAAPTLKVTRWIAPGEAIDLGGRVLAFTAAPGHSDDSIVLRDKASGRLFTGDTIYPGNVYAFLPGTDLAAYGRSIAALLATAGPDARLHGGHGCDGAGPVGVPEQGRRQLEALGAALGQAQQFSFDLVMPRTLPTGAGVTLLAKHPWMAKDPA